MLCIARILVKTAGAEHFGDLPLKSARHQLVLEGLFLALQAFSGIVIIFRSMFASLKQESVSQMGRQLLTLSHMFDASFVNKSRAA